MSGRDNVRRGGMSEDGNSNSASSNSASRGGGGRRAGHEDDRRRRFSTTSDDDDNDGGVSVGGATTNQSTTTTIVDGGGPGGGSSEPSVLRRRGRRHSSVASAATASSAPVVSPILKRADMIYVPPSRYDNCMAGLRWIVASKVFSGIMIASTLWALFAGDVARMILPSSVDYPFAVVSTVVFVLFIFELLFWSLAEPRTYFVRFFFWLDLLAVFSMLPEVFFIFGLNVLETSSGGVSLNLVRAGRAARAAARAARFVRVFKYWQAKRKLQEELEERLFDHDNASDVIDDKDQEVFSATGNELSNRITQKVIIGVLMTLLVVSFLTVTPDISVPIRVGLGELEVLAKADDHEEGFSTALSYYLTVNEETLVYLRVAGTVYLEDEVQMKALREDFLEKVETESEESEVWLSTRRTERRAALFRFILTILIVIILTVGQAWISYDAQVLAIDAIDRMTVTVGHLGENPLTRVDENTKMTETEVLEAMLRKVTGLLHIGFGVKGTSVVSHNLRFDENGKGDVDVDIIGVRSNSIFVNIAVSHFGDIVEILQEEAMIFTNLVVQTIHTVAAETNGSPTFCGNGEFGLLWSLPIEEEETPDAYAQHVTEVADNVLHSCSTILNSLDANTRLRSLLARINADYFPTLSFGVHVGWAIVGAIGSPYKVDAGYISPHLTLTKTLQRVAKAFRVDIAVSQTFFELLSSRSRLLCYKVDRALIKGSRKPITIYAFMPDRPDGPLRTPRTFAWVGLFSRGVQDYLSGSWEHARTVLQQCRAEVKDDGPTSVLMEYMETFNFVAPPNWAGWRVISVQS